MVAVIHLVVITGFNKVTTGDFIVDTTVVQGETEFDLLMTLTCDCLNKP